MFSFHLLYIIEAWIRHRRCGRMSLFVF